MEMMIMPIQLLITLQKKILENNKIQLKETKDKKKKKDLKAVNLVFNSNLHYLNKYCKKEKLESLEIKVDDNTFNEILGNIKEGE